ncbi:MAG: MFS transporter, partial [Candidatus Margulisiibacteriota bacterium]
MSNDTKTKLTIGQIFIIISASLASFMAVLDTYIVSIATPTIAEHFNVSISSVSKIMIVYSLILTTTVLIFGKLGDKFGLKKVFILGFVIFTLGSFLCGISPSFNLLIAARAIQALGGAMLFSMGLAITPKFLPMNVRGLGYGISSTFASLGIMLGNPIGGFITALWSWHWVFFINVPVGILAVIIAFKALPNDQISKNISWSFDLIGTILLFIAIPLLIFTINNGQTFGWLSFHTIVFFLLALFFLVLFFIQERTYHDPLLHFDLLKSKVFMATISSLGVIYGLLAGSSFLLPFLLEKVDLLK